MKNVINKYSNKLAITVILLICVLLLLVATKGNASNLYYNQSEKSTSVGSPFESSGSTSRYALTEAIIENHTFFFNAQQAEFASPDLVRFNGKYFSLFTPGVSLIGVPLYLLGKYLGLPQLFSYFINILAALLGILLIYRLSRKLGTGVYPAILSGLTFIFATNALPYTFSYTQHLLSTVVILASILNAVSTRNLKNNIIFGLLLGLGALIDIPNLVIMLPVAIYVLFKNLQVKQLKDKAYATIKLSFIGLLIGIIPLLILFGWYNYILTGSYTRLGQLIGRTSYFKPAEIQNTPIPVKVEEPSEKLQTQSIPVKIEAPSKPLKLMNTPYNPRLMLNGFYILLISNERGWVYYSPIVFVGLFGFFLKIKKQNNILPILLIYSGAITIISYSMFADPWGGWTFGPRYLIPAAAALCVGLGVIIDRFKKNVLFILIFSSLLIYSVLINSLGALTTSLIPPKVEAVKQIPYTYEYNWQLIDKNFSSSLFYNLFLKNLITARAYLYIYSGAILILFATIYLALILEKTRKAKK